VATGRRSTAYKPTRGPIYPEVSRPITAANLSFGKQNPGHYFVVSRTDHSILAKTMTDQKPERVLEADSQLRPAAISSYDRRKVVRV
jgi:hypothetical protein